MTSRAPRREQVRVAELLVRSAGREDASGAPGARHRQRSPLLRSLARVRVLSAVAGALAITGGVAAAVSQPIERGAGPVWPPVGLEPFPVALTPPPGAAVVPDAPESVPPPPRSTRIASAVVTRAPGSAKPASKHAAPVRHEIPDVPSWSRGHLGGPDRQVVRAGHHDGIPGHPHRRHGGGGRHRR